ncbi:hypothetical protein FM996_16780 [Methylosinus sporium]|uniref:Uncharacterized protein n=1 Tax=Methylosinus sporium TaxID=428 RepID=A0A549SLC1_METSR|nr:hypothetical protein [Methylosinus sporium]TRL30426.1 hypothetical protein FM996_16780 [Methylosinus sporium]
MLPDVRSANREPFPSIRLAGLMWEGTFKQAVAGVIGGVMSELRRRLTLTPSAQIFCVSWTDRSDGFRHFCGVKTEANIVVQGLELIEISALECLTMPHSGGDASNAYAFLMAERDRLGLRAYHDPSMIDEHLEDGAMRLWLAIDTK